MYFSEIFAFNSTYYWILTIILACLVFSFFDIVVQTHRTFCSILCMKVFTFIYTRNCKQETKHYIQENKTTFEMLFKLLLLEKDKLEQVSLFRRNTRSR